MACIDVDIRRTKMGAAGQRYAVYHDGELLVESTKNGIYDAARALVELGGVDLDDVLYAYVDGRLSLTGRLGYLITRTISETQDHGPRCVPWVPYFGPVRSEEE